MLILLFWPDNVPFSVHTKFPKKRCGFSENRTVIAESYGGEIRDCITDIDGDGKNELICNTKTLADSRREAVVYDDSESGILRGTLDLEAFGISPEDFVNTEYDCAGKCFIIETYDETGKVQTWKTIYDKAVFRYAERS